MRDAHLRRGESCYTQCVRLPKVILLSFCVYVVLGGTATGLSAADAPSPESATNIVDLPLSFPSASDSSVGLSIGTYAGIEYGTAKEFVYSSEGGSGYYKVSELDWPLQPSYYLGLRIGNGPRSGFSWNLDLRAAVPSNVGYVQDSDYLNGDGLRTNYSRHTGLLLGGVSTRADIGWRISLPDGYTITPFARFEFLDIKWQAQDGYYQYPPQTYPPYSYWSPSEPKVYLSGVVATYEQRYLFPAAGVLGVFDSGDVLSIGAGFAFSPLVWVNDIDNHFLRNLIFYDSMALGTYLEPELRLSFRPMHILELTFDLSYFRVTTGPNGRIVTVNTLTGNQTTSTGTGSSSGASIETLQATLSLLVHY